MSLAVLADHMASKGRGPDSMLIHMSPREVQGLQALAMRHGGSLTINPDTGLPEAGFLDKLLPTIIGAGISYFSGGTIDPMTAAAMVGGAETVRTGDIGRGLQAGLGAYGGAGLTAGMTAAGTGALTAEAAALAGTDAAAIGAAQGYSPELIAAMKQQAIDEAALQGSEFTAGQSLSKGFDLAKANPMQAVKDYAKPLMYAAGPAILAAASTEEGMPKTVTKPGMIRPYTYNPYSGGFVGGTPYEAAPTKAAEGGLMGMAQGGAFDFVQRSEPVLRMAEGGSVQRFAVGDLVKADIDKAYAAGDYAKVNELAQANKITAADVADTWKGFDTSGLAGLGINLYAPPAQQAAAAAPAYNQYTNEQIGSYLTANPNVDLATAIKTTNADPAAVNAYIASLDNPFRGSTETERGSGTLGIYNQMKAQGIDPNELYAASTAFDPKYAGWSLADIQRGYNLDKGMYALSDAKKGVVTDTDWAKLMVGNGTWDNPQYSVNDMAQAAGLSKAEVRARFELEKLKANPVTKVVTPPPFTCPTGYTLNAEGTACIKDAETNITKVDDTTNCPTGYHYDPVTKSCVPNVNATQNTTSIVTTPTDISTAPSTALPVGVSGAGITTINPNGTVTTRPDLSLGMGTVRDAYTRGGGSLGFIPYSPKSLKELEDKYPITGGSKQSYDYLMGRTPYSPTPFTKTGEVMKPYSEAVLGIPIPSSSKMYLFDPATKTYKINPDYAIPTYDKDGKKSYNLTNQDVINYVKSPEYSNDDTFVSWMTANNLSPEQVATATGISISEIYKKIKKAKPVAKVTDVSGIYDSSGGGGGDSGGPGGGGGGGGGGVGGAGGPASTSAASPGDFARGGLMDVAMARGGAAQFNLGDYSDGGRLLRGPGDGVSDSIPASIGNKRPARLADGEFVVPARIVSELGNGSTEAGARKLYAMMDRIQAARRSTVGKGRVAKNSRAEKYLPA